MDRCPPAPIAEAVSYCCVHCPECAICTVDNVDVWCRYSLMYGKTIDTLAFTQDHLLWEPIPDLAEPQSVPDQEDSDSRMRVPHIIILRHHRFVEIVPCTEGHFMQ